MSVPLHCSALGKVLLAYGAARSQLPGGPLERRTDKTITSRGGAARRAGAPCGPAATP